MNASQFNVMRKLPTLLMLLPEVVGHAVAQLVEALRYKSEGGGFVPDGVNRIFH